MRGVEGGVEGRGRHEQLAPRRGISRACPRDFLTRASMLGRLDKPGGSRRAAAIAQDGNHRAENVATHGMLLLYDQKTTSSFGNCRHLALTYDGSVYGLSYNQTLEFNMDTGIAAVLRPKVVPGQGPLSPVRNGGNFPVKRHFVLWAW